MAHQKSDPAGDFRRLLRLAGRLWPLAHVHAPRLDADGHRRRGLRRKDPGLQSFALCHPSAQLRRQSPGRLCLRAAGGATFHPVYPGLRLAWHAQPVRLGVAGAGDGVSAVVCPDQAVSAHRYPLSPAGLRFADLDDLRLRQCRHRHARPGAGQSAAVPEDALAVHHRRSGLRLRQADVSDLFRLLPAGR